MRRASTGGSEAAPTRPLTAFASGIDQSELPLEGRKVARTQMERLKTSYLSWQEIKERHWHQSLCINVTHHKQTDEEPETYELDTRIRFRDAGPKEGLVHGHTSAEVLALLFGHFTSCSASLTDPAEIRDQLLDSFVVVASHGFSEIGQINDIKDISSVGCFVPLGTVGDRQTVRYIRVTFEPALELEESKQLASKVSANDHKFVTPVPCEHTL